MGFEICSVASVPLGLGFLSGRLMLSYKYPKSAGFNSRYHFRNSTCL